MKKFTTFLLMAFAAVLIGSFSASAETGTTLIVHYQNWTEDYTGLGTHGWGGAEAKETFDGEDDFGVFFTFEDVPATGELGFIAVTWEDGSQNWDKKETGDVFLDLTTLKPGEVNHAYVFQGAEGHAMFLADSEAYNLLLVYADPSGVYEENIGVHAWNGWIDVPAEWGTPADVFIKGASHTAISDIKVAMLSSDSVEAGLLIYAGGDSNKKTGDVNLADALSEDPALGDVGVTYVFSKGDGYTAGDNIVYTVAEFAEEAFSFRLLPMGRDTNGLLNGTYAPNPSQVFVSLSANIANLVAEAETEAEKETALEQMVAWFTVREVDGDDIAIESVDFNVAATSVKDFVVILDGVLDNTKNYEVEFDLGLEGDENRQATLELDLDRNAPELIFASPSEIVGKEADERIILIEWNKKFPVNKFPTFMVNDDRDGDITYLSYVPAGEFSTINTNKVGDYKIMLRVEDSWGNVTEETFIFRVTKKMK